MGFNELVCNIVVGLITGLVSGVISGYIVYVITKKREQKYEAYYYCRQFLFSALEKCEMYIPIDLLHFRAVIDKNVESRWYKSTQDIIDYLNPKNHENKEYTAQEQEIFKNFEIAFTELEDWKNRNRLK